MRRYWYRFRRLIGWHPTKTITVKMTADTSNWESALLRDKQALDDFVRRMNG